MGKMTTYILTMSGILLLFYFTGLMGSSEDFCVSANPNNLLLCTLLSPEDMPSPSDTLSTSGMVTAIEGLVAGGIIVGAVLSRQLDLAVLSVFAIFLFNMMWSFLSVYNVVHASSPVLAIILFAPILFLFTVTVIEWWRGRD